MPAYKPAMKDTFSDDESDGDFVETQAMEVPSSDEEDPSFEHSERRKKIKSTRILVSSDEDEESKDVGGEDLSKKKKVQEKSSSSSSSETEGGKNKRKSCVIDEEGEEDGKKKKRPSMVSSPKKIVDLSTRNPRNIGIPRRVRIGGGWVVETGMVNFTSNGTSGSYEAFTLTKVTPNSKGSKGTKKDHSLNFPIRLLKQVSDAVQRIIVARGRMSLPEVNEIMTGSEGHDIMKNGKEEYNLTHFSTHEIPKIQFKIDELFFLEGQSMDFGNGLYDVLSFIRKSTKEGEDGKKKKDFTLSIPVRYMEVLRRGLDILRAPAQAPYNIPAIDDKTKTSVKTRDGKKE